MSSDISLIIIYVLYLKCETNFDVYDPSMNLRKEVLTNLDRTLESTIIIQFFMQYCTSMNYYTVHKEYQ
jgi:hypothetical protein